MATKKYQITQLQQDDSLLVLHPETDADIVSVTNGSGAYGGQATNVQDALEEVYALAETGGVTGVKGDAETGEYRTGDVNITKANIGLGNVTNDAQVKGLASGTTSGHIVTFGSDGYTIQDSGKTFTTSAPSSSSTHTQIPTSSAVSSAIATAIANIPKPMIFKGTLGTTGTITSTNIPTASADRVGNVYKVITAGTYNLPAVINNTSGSSVYTTETMKAGDLIVCTEKVYSTSRSDYYWTLIPSGDDIEDTWRSIKVNGTELLGNGITTGYVNFKNGSNVTITSSGNDVTIASSHPTITIDTDTSNSETLSASGTFTAITSVTRDTSGHALKVNTKTYTLPADSDTHNSHKVISGKKADGTTDIQSASSSSGNITLGDSGVGSSWASGVTNAGYSAVSVNAKGIVTAGGTIIEVGATSQTTPSSSLAVGGLFFKEV